MDSRKLVLSQTAIVSVGQLILAGVMVGVFALVHHFDMTVVWGALGGTVLSIGNFFAMAIGAMIAADKAQADDVKGGKATVKVSMYGRWAVIAVLLVVLAKSGFCNVLALAIPFLFTRPILTLWNFFRKPGEKAA